MKFRSRIGSVGALLLAGTIGLSTQASPANALPLVNPGGKFIVKIDVASNGGAHGFVSDTVDTSATYYTVLTSAGGGTCSLLGPDVLIHGLDADGFDNPSNTYTDGACTLYDATVHYTLTWTSLLGTTGTFPVTCTWVLGRQNCTLQSATAAISGIIGPIGS